MSITKTLGGDRLGSGNDMQVHMHNYERSTHDRGYIWRNTMAPGTLVPFIVEVAKPGDTFDIGIDAYVNTHPTVGPLFASFKAQFDVFQCPMRLYQGQLHNDAIGIGMKMQTVHLPQMDLIATEVPEDQTIDLDNSQINPSCILSYLGIRGVGLNLTGEVNLTRRFNALAWVSYWDCVKNYYTNKMEEQAAVIHTPKVPLVQSVDSLVVNDGTIPPALTPAWIQVYATNIVINYTPPAAVPIPNQIVLVGLDGKTWNLADITQPLWINDGIAGTLTGVFDTAKWGVLNVQYWRYIKPSEALLVPPKVQFFGLDQLDEARNFLLTIQNSPMILNDLNRPPFSYILNETSDYPVKTSPLEGLALKTYQSDQFNNWLNTEWIDGSGGINEITAIDTSGGSFTVDQLLLSRKVYDMLNRIAVSGGTYKNWIEVNYGTKTNWMAMTPMYMGGLSKEIIFQEVVSNAATPGAGDSPTQPLGTLAGKGSFSKKHKGGNVTIRVEEHSYIIGICSLTPRIDYSQGNKWDVHLQTMDDFHKPALDGIGFQDLPTEKMAWWDTQRVEPGEWVIKSAGKQPAWLDYMTNVNRCYGNFAIKDNEMFMTLNRRYETGDFFANGIQDLTTYIDPSKYNYIFADTDIAAQNFWMQIAVDMTVRQKMSAKLMPNL